MMNSDRWSSALLLSVAAIGGWNSRGFSELGGVFVWWTLGIMGVLGLALLVKGFIRPDLRKMIGSWRDLPAMALLLVSLIIYVALLPSLGFVVASSLFAGALAIALLGERRTARLSILASCIGVAVSVGLYAVFQYGFTVPLPVGRLWGLL